MIFVHKRKIINLNLESRRLPGMKGQFISERDVDALERAVEIQRESRRIYLENNDMGRK